MRAPSIFQFFSNTVFSAPAPSLNVVIDFNFNQANGSTPLEAIRSQSWSTGGAQVQSNALHVPGSGVYIQSPDTDYNIGTKAFKASTKFHLNSLSAEQFFIAKSNVGINAAEWAIGVSSTYLVFYYGTRGSNQGEIRFFGTFSAGNDYEVELGRDASGNFYAKIGGVATTDYQESPLATSLSFGSVITGTYNNSMSLAPSSSSTPITIGQFGGGYGLCDMEIDYCKLEIQP